LNEYQQELDNLRSVWTSLKELWDDLNTLRETSMNSVNPRTISSKLESLTTKINKLESWILQYAAVEHLHNTIRNYTSDMKIIRELRTEAVKERHWKDLRKQLAVNWVLTEYTLGNVFDSNIQANLDVYKKVINRAQGELGLEMYLKQVKDAWEGFPLELVNYNNKCFLIKGWDELFAMIQDHLKSLSAMHASPFFREFEEPAISLENKINRIRIICDAWIDVQRIWVYLEGVFTSNADIKYQLPQETQKFQSVNNEFVTLMRKVQKNPVAFEVINIHNILGTLERLNDLLIKIQKSLGEYLEKQRNAFPRFYFVGDEDLLEIIGNSDDPDKIQKHLKKMFAGISSLQIGENHHLITGMISREGETVQFVNSVNIEKMSIQAWLKALDDEMRNTLATLTQEALQQLSVINENESVEKIGFVNWIQQFPAQVLVLVCQIEWTTNVEKTFTTNSVKKLSDVTTKVENLLRILTDAVLQDIDTVQRKKYEHLITELVHQRDVTRTLQKENVSSAKDFTWLYNMRFYWDKRKSTVTDRLSIQTANASFSYGWEYIGVVDKLVQTPLTDRCYLALTQALHSRLGGSPFGPAGTGKTETVKALGAQMGRFVLVFNCDDNFDFKAMSRIFVGLCQCGAWGCFDEFNRLEEKILSAVSQQVQTIQQALRDQRKQIELIGREVHVSPHTGIFITMNPGYAGRSNLPDNLKQLFRNIAMVKPDKQLIAQVILFSQGLKQAERLSNKIVLFFDLCNDELSKQSHYDFGLRALKSVLVNAGYLKRKSITSAQSITNEGMFTYVYIN
jgi:dynein heavy chain 1